MFNIVNDKQTTDELNMSINFSYHDETVSSASYIALIVKIHEF